MPKLLVFQHVAHEILGTLDPLLRNSGFRIRYVNFGRSNHKIPALGGYDGLVVLGGPMNVDEVNEYPYLVSELKAIEQAIENDMPVFGICLGSQLIAKALGAKVRKNKIKEIGWYDVMPTAEGLRDPLVSKLNKKEKIFQWHGDTFDIPKGAIHLAYSPDCENQAFKFGERIYGFQFHLEVDRPMIERWLKTPGNVEELSKLVGTIDPEEIKKETPRYIERLTELSDMVFGEFINNFGNKERNYVLPSI